MSSIANSVRPSDRGLWPLASFILPLLVLLGIGSFGLWREREASSAEQNGQLVWQAQTAAKVASTILDKERSKWGWAEARVTADGRITGSAWYRQYPMPRQESVGSAAMAAGRWRDVIESDPGELSPAGLPLGPMAAFRLLQDAPDDGGALDAARTLRELAFAFPSVISPQLLAAADVDLTRRGLMASTGEPWQPRWQEVSGVASGLESLMRNGLPTAGESVRKLGGELWWVEVRPDQDGHLVRIFPLAKVIETSRQEWAKVPMVKGTTLALTSASGDLISRSEETAGWPKAELPLRSGALGVVALGDPSVAARATRLRVMVLGGAGLLAGTGLCLVWWRQRRISMMQHNLARQKDDFLSTVSRELRTPVAAMQVLVENLSLGIVSDPESTAVYHQRLLEEARGLASTTEHLLEFSLLERGQNTRKIKTLDLTALSNAVATILSPIADPKGVLLNLQMSSIEPPPLGDIDGIKRILINLGDNAIKFSPAGGSVEISIASDLPNHWTLSVRDQGPGIPRSEQARIFERFFRGGSPLDRETRGTGIGLAVARHLAEAHGGTLEIAQSSAKGSLFVCTLPLEPPPTLK